MNGYIKLSVAALIPVLVSAVLYTIKKRTKFKNLSVAWQQIIIGFVFGAVAIIGTEWGIPINGAQMNCRDAAPLCAGLLFGAPAGLIAGTIGAVERWIAVAWGVGSFTRVACSVSTFIAGAYAALLRILLFENKRPSWFIALASGIVMEVFHLSMVFITNYQQATKAAAVVKACSIPMVIANGLSVMLAAILLTLLSKEKLLQKRDQLSISKKIQRGLLVCVVMAYAVSTLFMVSVQTGLARDETEELLTLSLEDVAQAVQDASDKRLMDITTNVYAAMENGGDINELLEVFGVAEISKIGEDGIIFESTEPEYIGFDMRSGEQAAEFMCLLEGEDSYVQPYGEITSNSSISRKYAGVATEFGFLQVGYDAEQFHDSIRDEITADVYSRHVGETGFLAVASEDGKIISSTRGLSEDSVLDFEVDGQYEAGEMFCVMAAGEKAYSMYTESEGFYILAFLPVSESYKDRDMSVYTNSFMEIMVFAAMFLLIYLLVKSVVVRNIHRINHRLAEITEGNLNAMMDVRDSAEFALLSDDINTTVGALKRYIDEEAKRMEKDLELARSIQTSALPTTFPAFPHRKEFDIYATMDTAKEVGGDFYDFYFTGKNRLNLLMADVSGKGVPAAMFMMRARTQLKTLAESRMSVEDIFTNGNNALCEGNDVDMFVTAWQGCIDLKTGILNYANAGHNAPLLCRAGGKFEYLRGKTGFVLAGMEGIQYQRQSVQLQPGDTLFLYTDGVTEAMNSAKELYDEARLKNILNAAPYADAKKICAAVKADVDAFVGEAPQFDDITMLAFRYFGPPEEI